MTDKQIKTPLIENMHPKLVNDAITAIYVKGS